MTRQRTITACERSVEAEAANTRPSLKQLLSAYRQTSHNWTPENDGQSLDLADEIRLRLMHDYGLSKADTDLIGEAL